MRFASEWLIPGAFILILLSVSIIFGNIYLEIAFSILVIANIFFFRDPERKIPSGKNIVISPADGVVKNIDNVYNVYLKEKCVQITIFLNIWDVHVNRAPIGGIVKKITYTPGTFFAAYRKKSKDNEKNAIFIENQICGVIFIQSVGILARRVKCWLKENETVAIGQRVGIMMYGSRADVIIPERCVKAVNIKVGDRVKAGETVIAVLGKVK